MEAGLLPPKVLVALVVWATLLWHGYQARRPHWTPRSWRRFGLLLGVATGMVGLALVMAYGVDAGVYDSLSHAVGRLYFYTMMAFLLVGVLGSMVLLTWFAQGRADRQLD